MRNVSKGQLQDFFIISLLFFTISLSAFGVYRLLFTEYPEDVRLTVITEEMDAGYKSLLNVGDTIYDTLTKRALGRVDELEILSTGNSIRFRIGFAARHTPKGNALRTSRLWFRYEIA